jgi:hypothetical protein
MRITGSSSRLRASTSAAWVAGATSFAAAQGLAGRGAILIAAFRLPCFFSRLFLLETAFGIADRPSLLNAARSPT